MASGQIVEGVLYSTRGAAPALVLLPFSWSQQDALGIFTESYNGLGWKVVDLLAPSPLPWAGIHLLDQVAQGMSNLP